MGKWSDYFEDFPEENPPNCINGRFDPNAAIKAHQQEQQTNAAQAALDDKIRQVIKGIRASKNFTGSNIRPISFET